MKPRLRIELFLVFVLVVIGADAVAGAKVPMPVFEATDYAQEPEAESYIRLKMQHRFSGQDDRLTQILRLDRLVRKFYRAGALYVGIVLFMEEPQGLRVHLPAQALNRKQIFELVNSYLYQKGFSLEADTGQSDLVIWVK